MNLEFETKIYLALVYGLLQAGKIAKDIFIKQFRVVAGEKVLLSAIREICGAV